MKSKRNWPLIFAAALLFDLSDFFGGIIPGIGDAADILETGVMYLLSRDPASAISLIELVPTLDVVPSYILAACVMYFRERWGV